MQLLLTWSGPVSHDIATFFKDWLQEVLPGVIPWISDQDIAKGKRWFDEIMKVWASGELCMIFVTPENVASPWIYYEAGMIAVKNNDAALPYLVGVQPSQIRDTPLSQFQCTVHDKADTFRLIKSINQKLGWERHDESILEIEFNARFWAQAQERLSQLMVDIKPAVGIIKETKPATEELLSDESRQLLIEACDANPNYIMFLTDSMGSALQVGDKNLIHDDSPRAVANWKAAMDELQGLNLLEWLDTNTFALTKKGYAVADLLLSRKTVS